MTWTAPGVTMKRLIAALALAAAVGGCSSHPSAPKPAARQSVISRSYEDGLAAGEAVSLPNETVSQMDASCTAMEPQQKPRADNAHLWRAGCIAGSIAAQVMSGG